MNKKNNFDNVVWHQFSEGNLNGISIFTTEEYFNVYEKGNTDSEMLDDMINENINGKEIFDIGGFIGLSSLVFSKYFNKSNITTFEPNSFNRDRMSINFKKNQRLSKNITIYPYALSDSNQIVNMYLSEIIEGPSSTSRINGSHSTIPNEQLPNVFQNQNVESMKLDSFVEKFNIIPAVIKVDIEGAETMLLIGAMNTIEKYHPLLYIELHSQFCAYKCTELLMNFGYSISLLKEEKDNRIMVKAKYCKNSLINNDSVCGFELISNQIVIINNKINELEKIMESYNSEINVIKENNEFKERINELENINDNYKTNYSKIINSKSWKITKPLRFIALKIRGDKKNEIK